MEQEQSQPIFVPPMARIPQIPPWQVAGNRRVYGAPKPDQLASPYNPAQYWVEQPVPPPETPRPQLFALTPLSPCAGEPLAQTGAIGRGGGFAPPARTPPYCIPGEWRREAEPGIGETLLGCAVLLFIVVFALIVGDFLLV